MVSAIMWLWHGSRLRELHPVLAGQTGQFTAQVGPRARCYTDLTVRVKPRGAESAFSSAARWLSAYLRRLSNREDTAPTHGPVMEPDQWGKRPVDKLTPARLTGFELAKLG